MTPEHLGVHTTGDRAEDPRGLSANEAFQGPLSGATDPGHGIVQQSGDDLGRFIDAVSGDHFRRHLPHSPRVIHACPDDRTSGHRIEDVQKTPRRPDPWPVAISAALISIEHALGVRSPKRQDEVVVDRSALEYADAPGNNLFSSASRTHRLDALARRDPPFRRHH